VEGMPDRCGSLEMEEKQGGKALGGSAGGDGRISILIIFLGRCRPISFTSPITKPYKHSQSLPPTTS